MKLLISIKSQLSAMMSLLWTAIGFGLFLYYMDFAEAVVIVALPFWIIFLFMPAMYLHLEYFLENKNFNGELFADKIIFTNQNGTVKRVSVEEIEMLMLCQSAALRSVHLSTIDSYFFIRLLLKNGQILNLTCLLSKDMINAFDIIKVDRKEIRNRFFCSIKLQTS